MQKYLLLTYTRAAQAQEVGLFHTMPANATHCRFILNEDTNVDKILGYRNLYQFPKLWLPLNQQKQFTSSKGPTGLSSYLAK